MRYYRRKANQKAKAVLLKILFVILCAAAIFGLAILTGNLLKRHVEAASDALDSLKPPSGNAVSRKDAEMESDTDTEQYSTLVVNACAVDWIRRTEAGLTPDAEDALILRLRALAETYDTISLAVNDADGYYYTSPTLLTLLHQPIDTTEITGDSVYRRLSILCDAIKAENLRLSVRIEASLSTLNAEAAAILDGTIARELFAMGADEVLFCGLTDRDADTDAINYARTYLEHVREEVGDNGTIGALLPHTVYIEAAYAKQVQMTASAVDFLAIDLTDAPISTKGDGAMTMETICRSLKGSFQVYNMRVYLGGEPSLLAAQSMVLDALGITNRQYAREVTADALQGAMTVPKEDEDDVIPVIPAEAESETTPETKSRVNPYAVTRSTETSSSGDGNTEQPAETAPETEDLSYRTDGNSWY